MDFIQRTDALAAELGCDLGGLPETLGFSRSSLFAYRAGKVPISKKAWSRLADAEKRAGVRLAANDRFSAQGSGGATTDPDLLSIRDAASDLRTDSENMIREALNAAKLLETSHLETSQKLDSYAKLLKRSSGAASGWLKALEELYAIHLENRDRTGD